MALSFFFYLSLYLLPTPQTGSDYVDQAGLEQPILLPLLVGGLGSQAGMIHHTHHLITIWKQNPKCADE